MISRIISHILELGKERMDHARKLAAYFASFFDQHALLFRQIENMHLLIFVLVMMYICIYIYIYIYVYVYM